MVREDAGDMVESYEYSLFGMTLRRTLSQRTGTIDIFIDTELDEDRYLDWYYFGVLFNIARIGIWWSVVPLAVKYLDMDTEKQ